MHFFKYQGTGNDFVVLDRLAGGKSIDAATARRLCDRHTGIGADGVLTLWAHPNAAARMHIYNADGSEAEMCGNGIRCVVRYMIDAGLADGRQGVVDIAAAERVVSCHAESDGRIQVDMGEGRDLETRLPGTDDGQRVLTVDGERMVGDAVSMGNPHFVVFADTAPRARAEKWGKLAATHPGFVAGANVSFVRAAGAELDAVVYERGVGITQACGTGACAIGLAAVRRGYAAVGRDLAVHLPGGRLDIRVGADRRVRLTGPASRVFSGELDETEMPS